MGSRTIQYFLRSIRNRRIAEVIKMKIEKHFENQNVILTTKFGEKIDCKVLKISEKEIKIMTIDPPTEQVLSMSLVSRISRKL